MKKYKDIAFYIVTAIMILSGFLIHPIGNMIPAAMIHKVSALLFCIGLARHVLKYLKRIRKGKRVHVS